VLRQLPDGAAVLIRRIRPDDKQLLQQGLRHLSERSVERRFLSPKPKFSGSELRYLTEVDGRDHVALVAESPAEPGRRLLAVARFVRSDDDPAAAEAAIVVADDWQGRGLGSLLARELASCARELGIRRFTATMASDNLEARRLMQNLTAHLEQRHVGRGVSEMVLDLAA
jgi:RimJ/RimL family protein N-acetyltransferase